MKREQNQNRGNRPTCLSEQSRSSPVNPRKVQASRSMPFAATPAIKVEEREFAGTVQFLQSG